MSDFYLLSSNQHVRNFNKHAAVDLIRFAGRGISRTDIAEELGLTRAGVTNIINDLIDSGIILETESRSTPSGRPPVVLEINPKRGLVAAIDMGATHLGVALGDFSCRILDESTQPLCIGDGPERCLQQVDRTLTAMLEAHALQFSDLSAIGLGVPGPVISEDGLVMSPPIMPGWDGFPIRSSLEQQWGVPITLDNDADLGALGEWAYGAGRGQKNLVFIKVGSGIGAGLIINRQIFKGEAGAAGEIGHITIEPNGPLCACGSHGCLESIAGGKAIELQARKMVASGKRTLLAYLPLEAISIHNIVDAAQRGDLVAQELLNQSGSYIGIAIASLINLINPSVVIIGGSVAGAGDLLAVPIRHMVQERSLRASEHVVKITTAMLGKRSSLIGALVQASHYAIHDLIEKLPVSKNFVHKKEARSVQTNLEQLTPIG